MQLYPARVACRLAGISARSLDYWVTSGLVSPHSIYRGPKRQRDFFLFAFEQLVQLRIVAALRRTGTSLQKIRTALAVLSEQGKEWQTLWLLSDGVDVFVVRQPEILEALTGRRVGQLAFSVVAMGAAAEEVRGSLLRIPASAFDATRRTGSVVRYTRTSAA